MKPLRNYPGAFNRTPDSQQYEVGIVRSTYVEAEHLACENVHYCAEIYKGTSVADKREAACPHDVWS
jgi:hypothetical protein